MLPSAGEREDKRVLGVPTSASSNIRFLRFIKKIAPLSLIFSFIFIFFEFIDGRLDILNRGIEPDDLFEEEIQNCEKIAGVFVRFGLRVNS